MTTQTKILFLTANPSDTAELLLGEEIRLISARIRRGEYRKLFDIRSAPAIRATDLPFELMDQIPHIVHFSGHGTERESCASSAMVIYRQLRFPRLRWRVCSVSSVTA